MKKIIAFPIEQNFAYFTIILLLFAGCSENDVSEENVGETYIRAKFNDVAWEASHNEATLIAISEEGQRYDLTAWDEDYKIKLAIVENDVDGTMAEKPYFYANAFIQMYYGLGNNTYVSEHSFLENEFENEDNDIQINVTSASVDKISGTFSGTFYKNGDLSGMDTPEKVFISEGVFMNVPFESYKN